MAIKAEGHAERLGVIDLVHLVDLPMALDTADATIHMNGVIEIDVVRGLMNLDPRNWFAGLRAFANQSQPRVSRQNLIVAIHARRSCGNIRIPRLFDGVVAITAVQSKLFHVNAMRKRNWLNWLISHPRVLWCEVIPQASGHRCSDHDGANQNFTGQLIRPLWKNV